MNMTATYWSLAICNKYILQKCIHWVLYQQFNAWVWNTLSSYRISGLAEGLLASEEGLFSMEGNRGIGDREGEGD